MGGGTFCTLLESVVVTLIGMVYVYCGRIPPAVIHLSLLEREFDFFAELLN